MHSRPFGFAFASNSLLANVALAAMRPEPVADNGGGDTPVQAAPVRDEAAARRAATAAAWKRAIDETNARVARREFI